MGKKPKVKKAANSRGRKAAVKAMAGDQRPMERVNTGIGGLDELLEGGIPTGSLNLLAGRLGTGRMIFGLQYLYYGAKEKDEPGVFVSLEKEPESVVDIMKSIGWDPDELIEKKMLSIIKPDMHRFENLKESIIDSIDRIGAKRVVIKPFSLLTAYFDNVYDVRKALSDLRREMKRMDCTMIAVTDIKEGDASFSSTGFEEFVANGVIVLDFQAKKDSNEFTRTLLVRKMERTNHSLKLVPFEITKKGIEVYAGAEVF
ncbi:MAG: hypothetical protein NTV88_04750 [Candidatus Micrarchaeota archaeon]|nr:hypothetical protein [Candidatus Micrarchaeota archaeon]